MTIELFIEPRKTYTWEDFQKEKPPFSIALDGFVDAPTQRDPYGPYANFDHHTKSDRLATRSTSEQVHLEINLGLFKTFRRGGIPTANVYVNDPDEDTCVAWWLLKHHEMVIDHAQPAINRLVYCEDRLDSTAGAYPFGDTSMRRKMAWIFAPYNDARFKGKIAVMDAAEMRNVIESVEARINQHILGEGQELVLEGHYEKIGGGNGWTMTKETGPASRMAMYEDNIAAFVALVAQRNDGAYVYTLGRRSIWVTFDLPKLYRTLNGIESSIVFDGNRWGGSDTVGGSPRETGSRLPPYKLQEIINHTLSL